MHRMIGLMFVFVLVLSTAMVRSASAACPPTETWPSFLEIGARAKRVVIGTVTAADDGLATRLQVEEILRGDSRRVIDLAILRDRLAEDPATCPFDAAIPAAVGDRLAIAFNGRMDGWPRPMDTAALLDAGEAHPNAAALERLTTAQVRLLLGHEANGSTVAVPDRAKPPPDLFERLRRALLGDLFEWLDPPDADVDQRDQA